MSRAGVVFMLIAALLLWIAFGNFFKIYVGSITVKKRLKSYGRWAIVTGCTRGMGIEFARQLAELGMDIVLIARNTRLLDDLSSELRSNYDVRTVQIVADFAQPGAAVYDHIKAQLKTVEGDIGILVNNVGVFYESPRYYHEVEEKEILDIINVNITAASMLSHMIIKDHMLSRKKGLVVFIGSLSCMRTQPLFNAYAASKAYVEHLSRSLHEEYKRTGIYIQSILPSYVATDMAHYAVSQCKPNACVPSAQTYVKAAIAAFGMTPITSGYFIHTYQMYTMQGLPDWLYLLGYLPKIKQMRRHTIKEGKEEGTKTNK